MTVNARQFLDEVAEILRAAGRTVEIEESAESFGTFAWLYSPAPRWYCRSISLSARYSNDTKRWALGDMNIGPTCDNQGMVKTTRSSMKIAAEVYGQF